MMLAKTKTYNRLIKLVCTPAHYTMHYIGVCIIALVIATLTIQASTSVVVANQFGIINATGNCTNSVGYGQFTDSWPNEEYAIFEVSERFAIATHSNLNKFANNLNTTSGKSYAKATIFNFAANNNVKFRQLSQLNRETSGFTTQIFEDRNLIDIWFKLDIMLKKTESKKL